MPHLGARRSLRRLGPVLTEKSPQRGFFDVLLCHRSERRSRKITDVSPFVESRFKLLPALAVTLGSNFSLAVGRFCLWLLSRLYRHSLCRESLCRPGCISRLTWDSSCVNTQHGQHRVFKLHGVDMCRGLDQHVESGCDPNCGRLSACLDPPSKVTQEVRPCGATGSGLAGAKARQPTGHTMLISSEI